MPADDLRSALIASARAELAEHGSAALSLRAVARRAGVSHAAPAYHFTDKAGLLTAVAAEGFRELAAAMEAPVADAGPAVAELGRRYITFARENPALYELMFRPGDLRAGDAELAAAQAASLARLAAAAGSEAGQINNVAIASWAFAHGVASLAHQGALAALRPGQDNETVADNLVGTFGALLPPTATKP